MEKAYKRSRVMYIIEAALEYLISIFFANELLPELTKSLGISDGVTGIISAIISLGCVFQLVSILIRNERAKPIVLAFSIANQILFMLLYLIPLFGGSRVAKIVIFVIGILLAYLLYYIVHPKKINWFMSLVDDNKRGKFTSKKEIISLISGMGFSFLMSWIISYFNEKGKVETAFIIFASTIFVLMIAHSLTMIFSVEKKQEVSEKKQGIGEIFSTFRNKGVILVAVVFVLWNIATNSTKPFLGTYMLNTLGLAPWFRIGFLPAVSAVARIIASVILGIYADKKSFSKMVSICFGIAGASFLAITLCSPELGESNGYIMFTIHYILYGIAMGGINSSLINLCYDYAPVGKRVGALAVTQAISGVIGFSTATVFGLLVDKIQKNGNSIFGISIYAQQVVSIIGILFSVLAMLYVLIFLVLKKKKATVKLANEKSEKIEK
ncbi:MAG: MFS transporter [Clostridia bacterium]|nr:MFS transporter [Clostridia bacterium]